jgi:hypothetical protein
MHLCRVILFGVVSTLALAQEQDSTVERKVTLCYDTLRDPWLVRRASALASKIYAPIGIQIDWRFTVRSCPQNSLWIRTHDETPENFLPGALGSSTPYEGIHIDIFYDRILRTVEPQLVSVLLAHVLVHESAHILQGMVRHSATGIMKAKWGAADFAQMAAVPLPFTPQDVAFIYMGLDKRAARQPVISSRR